MIDEALAVGRRGLRTRPGTLLLGSTGARLWADFLEDRPGFAGAIDFIHKLNIPRLFTVEHGVDAPPLPSEAEWRPSHLAVRQGIGPLRLEERKFVTWDDCAVSLQTWHNAGSAPQVLRLGVDRDWTSGGRGERPVPARGFTLRMVVEADEPRLRDGLRLAPGETAAFAVAAAVGLAGSDGWDDLQRRARAWLGRPPAEALARQVAEYGRFFAGVPRFASSSPVLDRAWAYRWFLLRHNLARPGVGDLDGSLFYEGRSHKMDKTPWAPAGWEFSKLIPLSSPMHLIESRWHRDRGLGDDLLRLLGHCQGPDGQLHARTLNQTMHPYANFTGWAAYQYALARGLSPALAAALPMLKRQVRGEREVLATGGDSLPVQLDHRLTGKEYQPSYWYFHGYPDDPLDPATCTPLKRVDRAVYQHLNARGTAALAALLGDPEAGAFAEIAREVAGDVLAKQWDAATGFFYDLHHATDEKAMVRNVVGLYPYWAGLTGTAHVPGFLAALTPAFFDTPMPLPSVARDCPVFQPGGSWKGRFLKGRNGCMWAGPAWPYTNSIALDAIGAVTRMEAHRHDGLFARFFWKFVLMHFHQQDGRSPYLVEHYDSMTGEPISDEPDYNHSYLIDLVMRHVAGLGVGSGSTVRIDAVDIGLDGFEIDGIDVRGASLSLRRGRGGSVELRSDGRTVASRPDPGPLEWSGLPPVGA